MENERPESPEDLLWFLHIAELLERGYTQQEISRKLKKSLSFVAGVVSQVETKLGGAPLIGRGGGAGGKNELSEYGRKLLKAALEPFCDSPNTQGRLALAASMSLVTHDIVSPAIAEFLGNPTGANVQFSLGLKTELRFADLVEELRSSKIDLALVWGQEDRTKPPADLRIERFNDVPFDLVVVSSSERLTSDVNSFLADTSTSRRSSRAALEKSLRERFRGWKAVRLPDLAQPLSGAFDPKETVVGIPPLEVDTFDAALAVIKSRAADVTIVPAFYTALAYAQARGDLYFSNPVGVLPVVAMHLREKPLSMAGKRLIQLIRARLAVVTRHFGEVLGWTALPGPDELGKLKLLRYGYYIDGIRETAGGADLGTTQSHPPFRWKWEMIEWEELRGGRLQARFHNVDRDAFVLAVHPTSAAIVLEARLPDGSPPNQFSGQKFVSTFTQALTNPFRLLGVWTTTEPRSSGAYATVLSQKRLRVEDLRQIQQVSYRSVLSAEQGVRFEDQP